MRRAVWMLLLTAACGAFAQDPASLTIADMDDTPGQWRSKFTGHEVVRVERDGAETGALQLDFDLTVAPHYDWVRAVVSPGVKLEPYTHLSVRVWSDGCGAHVAPMLIRSVPASEANRSGEDVYPAQNRAIVLAHKGWKQFSIPLSAFRTGGKLPDEAHQFNFALSGARAQVKGRLMLDDLRLTLQPEGEMLQESVDYPPTDIAVKDEAEFFGLMDLDRPGLEAVRDAVARQDWAAAKDAWAAHLQTRTTPVWTWSRRDKARILEAYETRFGGTAQFAPRADRVLARDFDWLGVRKRLEKDVEWLQGPTEWTHVLSRHGYWKDLGCAYWATGDEKYAEDWVYMLKDWIADNPVPRILTNSRGTRGTVWRTLETGIRGDCWFDMMELFMEAPAFDADARYLMTRSLVEHARHLHRYTVALRMGNWQVVECTGLAAIGIMLPEFREAEGWRERALEYLALHMEKDVYPDGAHSELTPGYHGWVLERFLKAALLCQANGYEVPGLLKRHERMFEFLMHISRPDRRFWALGDAGSGGGIENTMGLGALLYGRQDMRFLGSKDIQAGWLWLFPQEKLDQYATIEAREPAFTSAMLPDAQYCVMRTGWERNDRALLFDCAPWGGGHSHQDRLQVLVYAGRDLLIDPGIYSYDQPLSSSYFRKGIAHNILTIDGQEQIQSNPEVLSWQVTDQFDLAAGRIERDGLSHQRTVVFVKPDFWLVVDHVGGEGAHDLARQFHLPKGEVQTSGRGFQTTFPDHNVWVASESGELEMTEGWIPESGSTAGKAPVAVFRDQATLPAALGTVIVPFSASSELPEAEWSRLEDGALAVTLTWPDGQKDTVAVRQEPGEMRIGEHSGQGRAICMRTGPRSTAAAVLDGLNLAGPN